MKHPGVDALVTAAAALGSEIAFAQKLAADTLLDDNTRAHFAARARSLVEVHDWLTELYLEQESVPRIARRRGPRP